MSAAIMGLVGVVRGSLLSSFKDMVAHLFKQRSNGRYAAVRIIILLDEYAHRCVSVVSDNGTCMGGPAGKTEQGEEYYASQISQPEPPSFPDDIDWRSIKFKLNYRILSFPNSARATDRNIDEWETNSSPPEFDEWFDSRQEGYAHLGLEAVNSIKELRKEFSLPETPLKFWDWGWDSEKFSQGKLNDFQTRRESVAAEHVMMMDDLTAARKTTATPAPKLAGRAAKGRKP